MQRIASGIPIAAVLASAAIAQGDYASFRAAIEQSLRQHPFFSRVAFTLVDRDPFLFCVERAPNDAKDHELGVVNGYLPFLRELLSQFDTHYGKPANLQRRPEVGGYALAVLSSAGRYMDFRTAIGDPSLAMARAHYTPSLRLAVTYVDSFARHNTKTEELHALLHEFVHALQHAHSGDGQMPKPVWFNEGLADYRSSCSNLASSLREPPLQANHVDALAFGYANPGGKYFVAPIADLVAANSYQEVVDLANKRNGAALPSDTLLSMFYAQSEMFVRFLHEGEGGKYRDGFVQYLQAAQRGESGLPPFQRALAVGSAEALTQLEQQWLRWLDGVLRKSYPTMRDLTKAAAGGAAGAVPMPPPTAIDLTALAWTKDDVAERLAGVRRLCSRGEYERALALLPADDELGDQDRAFAKRERARVQALITLREDALTDIEQKKGSLAVTVDGAAVRGRLVRREPEVLVVQNGRQETKVSLAAMTPAVLVGEGRRLKRFEGKERWLEIWTRWLKGDTLKSLQSLLALDYSTLPDMRTDLVGDCDAAIGAAALALIEMQSLPAIDDVAGARSVFERVRAAIRQHGASPLFTRRKAALTRLARGLAERMFQLDDMAALGIRGEVQKQDDGSVRVEYGGKSLVPGADFTEVPAKEREETLPADVTKIGFAGKSGLGTAAGEYQLVGSTWLRWAVGLRGKQVVELDFAVRADFVPEFGIAMCVAGGRMVLIAPTGGVQLLDPEGGMIEPVGGGAQLIVDQVHKLRVEHDGKQKLSVTIDGKTTAVVSDVGRMTAGELMLFVHASTPVAIKRLAIRGTMDPSDPGKVRERFVAAALDGMW